MTTSLTETLLDTRRVQLIKVWDAMFRGARKYVEEQGFVGVHNMPEIVGITGACENVDTLFKVDFFGDRAYLAQSDQLYLELLTPALGKVYAEMQSFRMEPDADDRHLCQFALFEIEHLGNLEELQKNIFGILQSSVTEVLDAIQEGLEWEGMTQEHLELLIQLENAHSLPNVRYADAVERLRDSGEFPDLKWGDDLKAEHEAKIAEWEGPCFITHYPLDIKFFNMFEGEQAENDEGPIVNSCDLILPLSGESAGAAEREHEHDTIERRLKSSVMYERLIELGGKDEDFAWYLDAHKDREVPLHSGAGIGMARVAQFIIGTEDIRKAVPFVINRENLL